MKEYSLRRMPAGGWQRWKDALAQGYAPGEEGLETAPIDTLNWADFPVLLPAWARLGWDEEGLYALLCAQEERPRASVRQENGMVCLDSCLEAFFGLPDGKYLNVEGNPFATLHIALGRGREDRHFPARGGLGGSVESVSGLPGDGSWYLAWSLPKALLFKAGLHKWGAGLILAGNFYKCGERTETEHYLSWSPIQTAKPDFHRPEGFGRWTLE